jgi:peptidyl-prolyl cis-trans isomerase B (cyclophilin B)
MPRWKNACPPSKTSPTCSSIIPNKAFKIQGVTLHHPHGTFCALMKALTSVCVLALALGLTGGQAQEPKKDEKKPDAKEEKKTVSNNEVAIIKTTEGEMVAEFWPDVAPKTVENFKTLAKKGFYDGTCFHRVIKEFMIQGGDPLTKDPAKEAQWGTGGPGYQVKAEFNDRPHNRGVLSMARSSDPDSAGSQFFICHGNPRFLDKQYTAFGKLIKGDDVLEKIATTPTHTPDRPNKRMAIESIKIVPADSVK